MSPTLELGARTLVMGVLNVTPDSFSDGGEFQTPERAVDHASRMLAHGADLIDVGGESTRPGAEPVDEAEEIARVDPAISAILRAAPDAMVSIDTSKAAVARHALQLGAGMVNDISGLGFDPRMAEVCAEHDAWVVIMHIRGVPRTMQRDVEYSDVVDDVSAYFEERLELAARSGIRRDKILLDPGIGFGKTLEHNLELLHRLAEFRRHGCPLLVGTSRKSFIGALTGRPASERAWGTAASVALAIANGADVVRVHDVEEMIDVVKVSDAIVRARM